MWEVINKFSDTGTYPVVPHRDVLLSHFTELSKPAKAQYFDYTYEKLAKENLHKYYSGDLTDVPQNELALYILNRSFTENEIQRIITRLKNNKSPGGDNIPSELIKECKESLCYLALGNLAVRNVLCILRFRYRRTWARNLE